METDKRLETLEEELKLMKGELKQSLAGVRDYLLNMELPSSEFATILAALGGEGSQKITVDGSLLQKMVPGVGAATQEEEEEPSPEELAEEALEPESELSPDEEGLTGADEEGLTGADEEGLTGADEGGLTGADEEGLTGADESLGTEAEMLPEDELIDQDENLEPEAELLPDEEIGESDEQDESLLPESEPLTEEEYQMEQEKINAEASQAIPKVNLLANLINWVAKAKQEIGYEQMPAFLEVYGVSGHLSPELKEVILNLVDIASEQPEDAKTAEIWSQAMLSLHGILTGGDAPLYPVKPYWSEGDSEIQPGEDEVIEVDKPKDKPVKLKLVFPNGDGESKEFCVDLTPEADNSG